MSWLEASQFVQGSYCQSYVTQHSHWLNQWHSVSVVHFIQKIMAGGCPVVVAQKQSIGCTNQVSRIWFTMAASHYIILYVCLITIKFVSFQCEARRSRLWMLNSVLWKLWMCFSGKYESSCCIRNNAFGKSSKQQIIYAAIAYEDILLPVTWLDSSTPHHKYQYTLPWNRTQVCTCIAISQLLTILKWWMSPMLKLKRTRNAAALVIIWYTNTAYNATLYSRCQENL